MSAAVFACLALVVLTKLVHGLAVGALGPAGGPSRSTVLYFSAEPYTSLGDGEGAAAPVDSKALAVADAARSGR